MLRSPRVTITTPSGEELPVAGIKQSYRQAPALIGLGLLEAISDDTLAALADPDDADGDGDFDLIVEAVLAVGLHDGEIGGEPDLGREEGCGVSAFQAHDARRPVLARLQVGGVSGRGSGERGDQGGSQQAHFHRRKQLRDYGVGKVQALPITLTLLAARAWRSARRSCPGRRRLRRRLHLDVERSPRLKKTLE